MTWGELRDFIDAKVSSEDLSEQVTAWVSDINGLLDVEQACINVKGSRQDCEYLLLDGKPYLRLA